MTSPTRAPIAIIFLALGAAACDPADPPGADEVDAAAAAMATEAVARASNEAPGDLVAADVFAAAAAAGCTVSGTNVGRSLVVTTPTILSRFSFDRVMSRIRTTARVSTGQTNRTIFQAWMKTFGATPAAGDCNDAGIDPNHYGLVCPRTPETKLATIDPFVAGAPVSFKPVALFNRFDLAPSSGANCGEYRIVYGMRSTTDAVAGRALIIFEATLPNPTPSLGLAGCAPIARFWQGLSTDASDASRAAKLEKFYLTGGAVAGVPAVVDAAHYGLARGATAAFGAGQVRTNFFVDAREWQLREFKLRRSCTDSTDPRTCRLRVDHVTVKSNPAEELFAGTHARSAAFRSAFVATVPTLAGANLNTIGMTFPDVFNEHESVSQTRNVVYGDVANATMRAAITSKLRAVGSTLTVGNVLDRATTQTCAGCHEVSNDVGLGGGVTWPSSLGFVQIDETGQLSPALRTRFLPHRKQVLESFINRQCAAPAASRFVLSDDGLTVGGSVNGAPN